LADPQKYQRDYSYTAFQSSVGNNSFPGTQLDNEFEEVEQSIGQVIDALKDVRRSDGKLQTGSVSIESLSDEVKARIASFASETIYTARDEAVDAAEAAEEAEEAAAAASNCVRFDAAQTLTDAQKVQGAANLGRRERLTAARTYYVRPNGNDANDGLANTAGGAFATIQKAYDTIIQKLDLNGFPVTIKLADGTYTQGLWARGMAPGHVNSQSITIQGNDASPQNVIIAPPAGNAIEVGDSTGAPAHLYLRYLELRAPGAGNANGLETHANAAVIFQGVRFGACGFAHIYTHTGGHIRCDGGTSYTVCGSATYHVFANENARLILHGIYVIYEKPVTFGCNFYAGGGAFLQLDGNTWVNPSFVTGARFMADVGGMIITGSTSLTYLPGSVEGIETGGFYDAFVGGWRSFTPVFTVASGALNATPTINVAKYKRRDKTVTLQLDFTVTAPGAAAGYLTVSLPFPAVSGLTAAPAVAINGVTTKPLNCLLCHVNTTTLTLWSAGGGFPAVAGDRISVSVTYEMA
jgi:hypothetical protein